jgi:hypothetical protein
MTTRVARRPVRTGAAGAEARMTSRARPTPAPPPTRTVAAALILVTGLAVGLACSPRLHAQQAPTFVAHEVRLGGGGGERGGGVEALHLAYDLDLGYLTRRARPFRLVVGAQRLGAGFHAPPGKATVTGVRAGLRVEPFGATRLAPRLTAAPTLARVHGDTGAETTAANRVGLAAAGGVRVGLDADQRWSAVAEAQHLFMDGAEPWSVTVGLRYTPLGRLAYGPAGRRAGR